MKQHITILLVLALLIVAPIPSYCQYFNTLNDVDSSYDWGLDIKLLSDGSYFTFQQTTNAVTGLAGLANMKISSDGATVLSKKMVQLDGVSIYPGLIGQVRRTNDNGYVSAITIQKLIDSNTKLSSGCGIIKYNASGDTLFSKKYTDTSIYFEGLYACAVMQDNGYVVGGLRSINAPSNYPCLVIRTDSMGDTLWTRTYQKNYGDWAYVDNIIPISGGRIVVGASSVHYNLDDMITYYHEAPWFMVLDSMGNILKDTIYGPEFGGGGSIYKDSLGGYIHTGWIDTFETDYPSDYQNFPSYVAHLDTNFNIEWITRFPYNDAFGNRHIWNVLQMHDGNFIVDQGAQILGIASPPGWAAKIERTTGAVLWNHYYQSDSMNIAYLTDAIEKPDGSLVFTGITFNDTLPTWRDNGDVWLLSVDSNGCEIPGCGPNLWPNAVTDIKPADAEVKVYPNPADAVLNFVYTQQGNVTIKLMDITGRVIDEQMLENSSGTTFNVERYAPGIYVYQVITNTGIKSGKAVIGK